MGVHLSLATWLLFKTAARDRNLTYFLNVHYLLKFSPKALLNTVCPYKAFFLVVITEIVGLTNESLQAITYLPLRPNGLCT